MAATEVLVKSENDVQHIISVIKSEFESLHDDQLNWKSSHKEWSILECVDHLNLTLHHYLPEIKKSHATSKHSFKEAFTSGKIAQKGIKRLLPDENKVIKYKMKTFKKTNPSFKSKLSKEKVFEEFISKHEEFLQLIDESYQYSLDKNKVKTLLPFLKFKLGDVFMFLIAHEQRHIVQAQNVFKKLPML